MRSEGARLRAAKYRHKKRRAARVTYIQQGEGVDERVLMKRVLDLGRRRQLPQLLKELRAQQTRPGIKVFNAAINACCQNGNVEAAYDLMYSMEAPGGPGTDVVTYGTLMKGLGQLGKVDDAWWLMERWENRIRRRLQRSNRFLTIPKSANLEVPLELLYSLMNACAEQGDVARAKATMFRFNGSFIANERVFNILLKACSRSTRPIRAAEILQEMVAANVAPTRLTYNLLMQAASKGARADIAWLLLRTMDDLVEDGEGAAMRPDVITITALLTAETRTVGAARSAEEALSKPATSFGLDEVLSSLPLPHNQVEFWADLLGTEDFCPYDETPMRARVQELADRLYSEPDLRNSLDRIVLTALVHAFLAADELDLAEYYLQEMLEFNLKPKPAVYLLMMEALAKKGPQYAERACFWCDRMMDRCTRISSLERAKASVLVSEACIAAGQFGVARGKLQQIRRVVTEKGSEQFGEVWEQAKAQLVALYVERMRANADLQGTQCMVSREGSFSGETWPPQANVVLPASFDEFEDDSEDEVLLVDEGESPNWASDLEPLKIRDSTPPSMVLETLLAKGGGTRPLVDTEAVTMDVIEGSYNGLAAVVDAKSRLVGAVTTNALVCAEDGAVKVYIREIMQDAPKLPSVSISSTVAEAVLNLLQSGQPLVQVLADDGSLLRVLHRNDLLEGQ